VQADSDTHIKKKQEDVDWLNINPVKHINHKMIYILYHSRYDLIIININLKELLSSGMI